MTSENTSYFLWDNFITILFIHLLTYFVFLVSFAAFSQQNLYEKEIAAFRKIRIDSLQHENGYLNLSGLFWLKEGENTIGADPKNDFVFPTEHSDSFLGTIILNKGVVTFNSNAANQVFSSGQSANKMIILIFLKGNNL